MKPRRIALLALLLAALPASAQLPTATGLDSLRTYVEFRMERNNIPGVVVGVVLGDELVFVDAFGLADVENGVPVTDSTVFEIGSVTKQFVAVAALQLVGEGRLELDAHVHDFLHGLPSEWRGVTVRHLLNHTSGIPDYEEIAGYAFYDSRATLADVVEIAHSRALDFPIGTAHRYSNTGYYLLSAILEEVDGRSIGALLEARIFEPLGMHATRMADPEAIVPRRARGYYQDRLGTLVNRPASNPSATLGAGGLVSTVHDLAKWTIALDGGRLLSEERKAEMWAPTILPGGERVDYGFGWEVEPYQGLAQQYHYGMTHGFVANLTRIPDRRLTVIALANRYREDLGRIVVPTLDLFLAAGAPGG